MGNPDAATENFVVWDDWGGLTTYYSSDDETTVGPVIGALFRPVIDVEQLDIGDAYLQTYRETVASADELKRVHRSLSALLAMLTLHGDSPEFLADVLGDSAAEFETILSGLVAEWESVADQVPGRYTRLTVDNVPAVLQEQAGLSAFRDDLRRAVEAIGSMLASSQE